MATWCKELTCLKRPWFWERLKAGGEGDCRGLVGRMASLIQWTWVWVSSRSCWWRGKPGVLQSMGLQRVRHDWDWMKWNIHDWMKWISVLTKQLAKEQNNIRNLSGSECHPEYSSLKDCMCEYAKRWLSQLVLQFQPLSYFAVIYMNAKHFGKHYRPQGKQNVWK